MDEAFTVWLMSGTDHDLPDLQSLLHRPAWMAQAACRGSAKGT
jgi:hypothetical protein